MLKALELKALAYAIIVASTLVGSVGGSSSPGDLAYPFAPPNWSVQVEVSQASRPAAQPDKSGAGAAGEFHHAPGRLAELDPRPTTGNGPARSGTP